MARLGDILPHAPPWAGKYRCLVAEGACAPGAQVGWPSQRNRWCTLSLVALSWLGP